MNAVVDHRPRQPPQRNLTANVVHLRRRDSTSPRLLEDADRLRLIAAIQIVRFRHSLLVIDEVPARVKPLLVQK